MSTIKASEIREMSVEHLNNLLKETEKSLFNLRMQARMERLDSPSELKRAKQLIARIKTVQKQRILASQQTTKQTN